MEQRRDQRWAIVGLLVALAVLAAACTTSGDIEVEAIDAAAESDDEPTAVAEPTAEPEPTPEPTATPEPEPTPEPTATPEPPPDGDLSALEQRVAAAMVTSDFDPFPIDQDIADCAAAGLVELFGAETVIDLALDVPGAFDEAPPPELIGPFFDVYYDCATPEAIGEILTAEFVGGLGVAITPESEACLAGNFGDADQMRPVFEAAAEYDDFDDAPAEVQGQLFDLIFGCIGLGDIVVSFLPIDISADSLACVNTEGRALLDTYFRDPEVGFDFDNLPVEAEDDFVAVLFGCLTPDELADLGGL